MKIILNKCFGGFGVSKQALEECAGAIWTEGASTDASDYVCLSYESEDKARVCPRLIAMVERDSEAASGPCAALDVVEIPDNEEWEIQEYDGQERIGPPVTVWG